MFAARHFGQRCSRLPAIGRPQPALASRAHRCSNPVAISAAATPCRLFHGTVPAWSVQVLNSKGELDNAIGQGSSEKAIVYTTASWCGPCKAMGPIYSRLADDKAFSSIKFYKADIDEQPEIAGALGVRAVPTFYLFKDGVKQGEIVGANPSGLENLLKSVAGKAE